MCTHTCLYFFLLSFLGYSAAAQFLPTRGSSPRATRSTRTFRRSSPSRRPCGAQLRQEFTYMFLRFRILCTRHFVIYVINNIRTRFIISFYVICAVIYYSFCCIYVWLDPVTYMIARFMSFYKPGVTFVASKPPTCLSHLLPVHRRKALSWSSPSSHKTPCHVSYVMSSFITLYEHSINTWSFLLHGTCCSY